MRTASLMFVLLFCVVLGAEEPQAPAKPAADAKDSAPAADQAGKAEKSDEAKKDEEGDEKAEQPLHKSPTLLKMLARNNELRQARGLRPHRINPALTKAAQDHAAYMARTRVFSHYSNGGPGGRAVRHGFGSGVRENIGYGYGNVENMFSTWFNSSGHWANMMSNTADAGFGYAVSPDGTPYWVAVYGTAPAGQEPKEEEAQGEVKQASATEDAKDSAAPKATDSEKSESKTPAKAEKVKQDPAVAPATPR